MESKNILLVDDTVPLMEELSSIFEMEGYHVTCFSSAIDALDYLKKDKPDIIISDVVMPLMSGIEFVEKIRQNESTQNTPVIILTADNSLVKSEILDKFNILALLTKPCNIDKLLYVIQEAIDD